MFFHVKTTIDAISMRRVNLMLLLLQSSVVVCDYVSSFLNNSCPLCSFQFCFVILKIENK